MIMAVPCKKISAFKFACKVIPKQSTAKKIGKIFYCVTKLNFKTVSWLPFLSILTVEKPNKRKVNTRNFASD